MILDKAENNQPETTYIAEYDGIVRYFIYLGSMVNVGCKMEIYLHFATTRGVTVKSCNYNYVDMLYRDINITKSTKCQSSALKYLQLLQTDPQECGRKENERTEDVNIPKNALQ